MAQASFVEFSCEPSRDDFTDGLIGGIGVCWMVFRHYQRLVFHEIASKERYVAVCRNMKKRKNFVLIF